MMKKSLVRHCGPSFLRRSNLNPRSRKEKRDCPPASIGSQRRAGFVAEFTLPSAGLLAMTLTIVSQQPARGDGGHRQPLPTATYVNIHPEDKRHLLREKMGTLEEQLDPSKFARIHRSTIIRTDRIKTLKPLFNGDYQLTMIDGKEFTLSRPTGRECFLPSVESRVNAP
jgi:hypothetical protein